MSEQTSVIMYSEKGGSEELFSDPLTYEDAGSHAREMAADGWEVIAIVTVEHAAERKAVQGGHSDFNSETIFEAIEGLLVSLESGYGLNRNEAVKCLAGLAACLENFKPGDPGLDADFHGLAIDCADDFQSWAEKVCKTLAADEEGD